MLLQCSSFTFLLHRLIFIFILFLFILASLLCFLIIPSSSFYSSSSSFFTVPPTSFYSFFFFPLSLFLLPSLVSLLTVIPSYSSSSFNTPLRQRLLRGVLRHLKGSVAGSDVAVEVPTQSSSISTERTLVWFLSCMCPKVSHQGTRVDEIFSAQMTCSVWIQSVSGVVVVYRGSTCSSTWLQRVESW